MKAITINGNEYKLEFSFEAAEHRDLVQKMFNVVSGAYILKRAKEDEDNRTEAVLDGTSEMVAEMPHICITAFYAGLLENNPVSQEQAKALMKSYMKENKLSYSKLYEEIKQCMEDDGFFDLSGLSEMMEKMNGAAEEQIRAVKAPQDHKRKQTSTK